MPLGVAAWTPSASQLNTVNEFNNLSHTISYTDELGVSHPVTITAVEDNVSVNVSGNTISGYYSYVFENTIFYRTIFDDPNVDEFYEVTYFTELPTDQEYQLYHFHPDMRSRKTYSYIASAGSATQTYTINVDNDWSYYRDQLLKYIYPDQYATITRPWINTSNQTITWINSSGDTVVWENNL